MFWWRWSWRIGWIWRVEFIRFGFCLVFWSFWTNTLFFLAFAPTPSWEFHSDYCWLFELFTSPSESISECHSFSQLALFSLSFSSIITVFFLYSHLSDKFYLSIGTLLVMMVTWSWVFWLGFWPCCWVPISNLWLVLFFYSGCYSWFWCRLWDWLPPWVGIVLCIFFWVSTWSIWIVSEELWWLPDYYIAFFIPQS